jgi:50S ribosomal protein L16 3-hydroxylase
MQLKLPNALSTQDFLDQYWQKKPLLMRNAIQNYAFSLSAEELAGLSCEEEVESRMVLQHGTQDWELRHGPFDDETFACLPDKHWTLLVQDVDKYIPHIAKLQHLFHFIPSWRFDDVMISYAVTGGSVGPHTDTYDVFLVQAQGKRRWQTGNRASSAELLPDLPVRILDTFEPEEEWLLEAGDVLYLPPGVAHWGIAEDDDCMTWSVGLRAPSTAEMLGSYAQYLLDHIPETEHFRDPPLSSQSSPSKIQTAALSEVSTLLDHWLDDTDMRKRWFGCFSTEIKEHLFIDTPEQQLSESEILAELQHASIQRHPFSRFAWATRENGDLYLFACGEAFELPADCRQIISHLCDNLSLDEQVVDACRNNRHLLETLTELINQNWLELVHD